jgi:hypothetical protein
MIKIMRILLVIILGLAIYSSCLIAQEDSESDVDAKKEAIKKRIELMDSNDYVVVLIDGKKVRVRIKPVVKEESDLVWMFVRKKSGQFNYESINKALIDYEKTEEYNKKLDDDRKLRKTELAKIAEKKNKELEEAKLKGGQLQDQGDQTKKVFTQYDLNKKTLTTKAVDVSDIVNLDEIPGWNIVIVTENETYNDIILSLIKGNGDLIFTTTIKDLLSLQSELKTQMEAYRAKVQEYYDLGTAEGDKYKYSGKIVEIQALLQDYEKKLVSLDQMIAKLPPKPEENTSNKSE